MPWCDSCSVYRAPTVITDGECPDCGTAVDAADDEHAHVESQERTVGQSAPWHFWIVVVALVAYIGWRIVDAFMRFL